MFLALFFVLTLMRLHADGRFAIAGRHEPIVIWRAATQRCEVIETPGLWVGVQANIATATVVSSYTLASGDVMVLHTDGISEAVGANAARYSVDQLEAAIATAPKASAATLRDALFAAHDAWTTRHEDDATIVVVAKR